MNLRVLQTVEWLHNCWPFVVLNSIELERICCLVAFELVLPHCVAGAWVMGYGGLCLKAVVVVSNSVRVLRQNKLSVWRRAPLERLRVVKHFMEPECLSPNSQELSTYPCPGPDHSSPHQHPVSSDIPSPKFHPLIPSLRSFIQIIRPSPKLLCLSRNIYFLRRRVKPPSWRPSLSIRNPRTRSAVVTGTSGMT
jgi:hypothetical protein